jgi:prevent-host-death family protein
MPTMSAKDAKNRFGELLLEAQREPVTIERNGRPVAVVQSWEDWQEVERMKLEWLKAAVAEGIADADAGRVSEVSDADAFVDEIMRDVHGSPKAAE